MIAIFILALQEIAATKFLTENYLNFMTKLFMDKKVLIFLGKKKIIISDTGTGTFVYIKHNVKAKISKLFFL